MEIYKKYYSKIPYDVFLSIVQADPQSKVKDNTIERIARYLNLIPMKYDNPDIDTSDCVDVIKHRSVDSLINRVKRYVEHHEKQGLFRHILAFHELSWEHRCSTKYLNDRKMPYLGDYRERIPDPATKNGLNVLHVFHVQLH